MRMSWVLAVGLISAGFATGVWAQQRRQQQPAPKQHSTTMTNLDAAMHGEAFATLKYGAFAKHAREEGHSEIAAEFEKTAKVEHTEHFGEEAILAGLVKSDAENLKNAIAGEEYESRTMYPSFAAKARSAGDTAAAQRFEEIARDEQGHAETFRRLLGQLEPGTGGSGAPKP